MTAHPTSLGRLIRSLAAGSMCLTLATAGPAAGPGPFWLDPTHTLTRVEPGREPLAPATPGLTERFAPKVLIAPGASPGGGYLSLSLFGVTPIGGVGDDTLTNFNVPTFLFGSELYSRIGIASNGYVVLGGGEGVDNSFINQALPDANPPNNVLAPYWTDLNPGAAGALRVSTLTDGSDTWIVVEWEAVREFSLAANKHSFQIWIGLSTDAHPAEDVTFAYGATTGNGDGGFLTVGVENWKGNYGQMTYFNGAGVLPVSGTQLRVTTDVSSEQYLPVVFR